MRIMGLDFGAKTVGVAISDPLLMTAQPVEVIRRDREDKLRRSLARIEELIGENGVGHIVLGMPYNMDGSIGSRGELTLAFKEQLERRSGLPVILWDERLTTVEADEVMEAGGVAHRKRGEYVDMVAASLILRDYMAHCPHR